jgi:hypothetical protein
MAKSLKSANGFARHHHVWLGIDDRLIPSHIPSWSSTTTTRILLVVTSTRQFNRKPV